MVVSNDIWHVTSIILLPRSAPLFFPNLVCHLIICFVHFSRILCKWDGCNQRRNKFSMMPSFLFFIKVLRRNKIQGLEGGSFDLPASGLWAQHASTAPSCSDAVFTRCFLPSKSTYCEAFLTLVQNGWLELPEKRLHFLVGFFKKQKVLLGEYNRDIGRW